MTTDDNTRQDAIKLLAEGLGNPSEIARLLGRSKQIVAHWTRDIDWRTARAQFLRRQYERLKRNRDDGR